MTVISRGPLGVNQKMRWSAKQKKKKALPGQNNAQMGNSEPHKGTSNSFHSSSSCNSHWKYCLLEKKSPSQVAKGVWEFGNMLGLECNGNERG